MGAAFDAACEELCEVGQLQIMMRKVVAQRILAAARKGDLEPGPITGGGAKRPATR
jgi:hypothetical protein